MHLASVKNVFSGGCAFLVNAFNQTPLVSFFLQKKNFFKTLSKRLNLVSIENSWHCNCEKVLGKFIFSRDSEYNVIQ